MRIAHHLEAQRIVAELGAPELPIGEEEALLGRKAVDLRRRRLAGEGMFERIIGDGKAAEIGDVLAQRELAVDRQAGQRLEPVEFVHELLRARLELGGVRLGPPVGEVAIGVVEPAPVIEAVRDLVADDHADAAVVDRVVERRVEERRLEDGGEEHDLVGGGLEVGVDHLRGQVGELVAVDLLADPAELPPGLERAGAADVLKVAVPPDGERGIVTPLERTADERAEARELFPRPGAGGFAHPVDLLEMGLHRRLDVVDHHREARPHLGRQIAIDVKPADGLTDLPVKNPGRALPARLHRRHAGKHRAVEVEALLLKRRRQIGCGVGQHAPAQVDLPAGQGLLLQYAADRREKLRLVHNDRPGIRRIADGRVVGFHRKSRTGRRQLIEGHLVVVGDGVAQLDGRLGDLRERLLEREHRGGILLRRAGRRAGERQHLRDVAEVGGALFFEAWIKIIIARRQAEAALGQGEHVGVALLLIRGHGPAEERRAAGAGRRDKGVVKIGDCLDEVVHRGDGVDAGEVGREGLQARGLDGGGVHRRGVEVADFLRQRARLAGPGGGVLEQLVHEVAVVLIQHLEAAPDRFVGGDPGRLVPVAGGVARKVDTRVDGQVHVGHAEAWHGRLDVGGPDSQRAATEAQQQAYRKETRFLHEGKTRLSSAIGKNLVTSGHPWPAGVTPGAGVRNARWCGSRVRRSSGR